MSEASIVFMLEGVKLTIKCITEDKMKDICKNYSTKINRNLESLLFLYEGNKVNFDLTFKEHANDIDRNNHEMKILVNKNDNNINNINDNIIISNIIKTNSGNVDNLKNGKVLLDNIKSIYFSRIVFSHLDEKIKLKLIKYNKKLQNKIDINLINYKFYSGKYIIYETKTKGKEYNGHNDNLLFEGEYLNGGRNGKGKEYYSDGNLLFEGDYLNGARNGKGKEYYYDVDLGFEDEYLNGKRNGKGKEYYENGKIRFEGEYLNDERLTSILYDNNGNLYYDINSANGLYKEYDDDGKLEFEGEYLNGKRNGKGKEYIYGDLVFEGEYLNGKRNGKGKEYYYDGKLKFEGEYLNGKRNGKGKKYYKNGNIKFEGIYNNGLRYNGIGYDIMNNKDYELKNGEGYIKEYFDNGQLRFEGEYLNVKINGKGKEYYNFNGKLKFEVFTKIKRKILYR